MHIVLFFDSSVSPKGCHHPLSTEPLAGSSPHRREPGQRGLPPKLGSIFFCVCVLYWHFCSENVTAELHECGFLIEHKLNEVGFFFTPVRLSDLRLVGFIQTKDQLLRKRDEQIKKLVHRVSVTRKWLHSPDNFTVNNSH